LRAHRRLPLVRAALQSGTSACEECAPGPEAPSSGVPQVQRLEDRPEPNVIAKLARAMERPSSAPSSSCTGRCRRGEPWGVGRAGAKDRGSERRRGKSRTLTDTIRSHGVQGDSPQSLGNGPETAANPVVGLTQLAPTPLRVKRAKGLNTGAPRLRRLGRFWRTMRGGSDSTSGSPNASTLAEYTTGPSNRR
jgi:hypothetical protein